MASVREEELEEEVEVEIEEGREEEEEELGKEDDMISYTLEPTLTPVCGKLLTHPHKFSPNELTLITPCLPTSGRLTLLLCTSLVYL